MVPEVDIRKKGGVWNFQYQRCLYKKGGGKIKRVGSNPTAHYALCFLKGEIKYFRTDFFIWKIKHILVEEHIPFFCYAHI